MKNMYYLQSSSVRPEPKAVGRGGERSGRLENYEMDFGTNPYQSREIKKHGEPERISLKMVIGKEETI